MDIKANPFWYIDTLFSGHIKSWIVHLTTKPRHGTPNNLLLDSYKIQLDVG